MGIAKGSFEFDDEKDETQNDWDCSEKTAVDGERGAELKAREAGPTLVRLFRAGLEDGSIQHACGVPGHVGECVTCSLLVIVNDID